MKLKRRSKLPKPYYETELGKLYHGDCLDIIPLLPKVDLILADPPYRQTTSGGGITRKRKDFIKMDKSDLNNFKPEPFLELIKSHHNSFHAYIFCSKNLLKDYISFIDENKYGWDLIVMNKNNPIPTKKNKYLSDTEYIIFIRSTDKTHYFNNFLPYRYYKKVKRINVKPHQYHITEKQPAIISELLKISTTENQLVLDPFIGGGTTAVVCEYLNRKWIGIEKKESDCNVSAKRIENMVRRNKQKEMFFK